MNIKSRNIFPLLALITVAVLSLMSIKFTKFLSGNKNTNIIKDSVTNDLLRNNFDATYDSDTSYFINKSQGYKIKIPEKDDYKFDYNKNIKESVLRIKNIAYSITKTEIINIDMSIRLSDISDNYIKFVDAKPGYTENYNNTLIRKISDFNNNNINFFVFEIETNETESFISGYSLIYGVLKGDIVYLIEFSSLNKQAVLSNLEIIEGVVKSFDII